MTDNTDYTYRGGSKGNRGIRPEFYIVKVGLNYHGPFNSYKEAVTYVEDCIDDSRSAECSVEALIPPPPHE